MEFPLNLPTMLLLGALLVAAIGVYQTLIRRVVEGGGKVRSAEFSLPDLLTATVLASFFTMLIFKSLMHTDDAPKIKPENVLPSASFLLIVLVGIVAFLRFRGVNLQRLLGFDRLQTGRALMIGIGLILAAFPIITGVAMITQTFLHEGAKEQELVTLFREVARKSDISSMAKILIAGVVFAPVAEEFLFRGYFYGVLKRYCGGIASGFFTSALFASIHMNLASLPSLFVLAICLTLAYEATGCLLVPIGMHAFFNFSQLAYLYLDALAHGS